MRLMRQMASRKSLSLLTVLLLLQLNGCTATSTEDNDTTNTFVTVVSMGNGDNEDNLASDVCTGTGLICTVTSDLGVVVMTAQVKNLKDVSSLVNDIVFTRYRVTYVRADGRNVPGVDVPFPFDGVANFRVPADSSTISRSFLIVRVQAKLESPLTELAGLGGSVVISTIARVDFFGQDLAGRQLQVTGYLNVTFADFADS